MDLSNIGYALIVWSGAIISQPTVIGGYDRASDCYAAANDRIIWHMRAPSNELHYGCIPGGKYYRLVRREMVMQKWREQRLRDRASKNPAE